MFFVTSFPDDATALIIRSHSQAANVVPLDSAADGERLNYRNDTYHFALAYPADLVVEEFNEDGGVTIVFQRPEGKVGFQISIGPNVATTITQAQIARDFPTLQMHDATELIMASGTPALSFAQNIPGYGEMRDIWFTHDGYLFEVTTFPYLDAWLGTILKSWEFI